MIPCNVCGQDIGGGWCLGFPPAPDSQKMGLCAKHDLPENRRRVQIAWQRLIFQRLEERRRNNAFRAGERIQLLSLYFNGGSSVSLPCLSFSQVDDTTLKVVTPDGEQIFFPLAQVRNYALSPLEAAPAAAPQQLAMEPLGTPQHNLALKADPPKHITAERQDPKKITLPTYPAQKPEDSAPPEASAPDRSGTGATKEPSSPPKSGRP